MSFIGARKLICNLYRKITHQSQTLLRYLHENTPWNWPPEHKLLSNKVKPSFTFVTELTIPNTKNLFFITVEASLIGIRAVLIQHN